MLEAAALDLSISGDELLRERGELAHNALRLEGGGRNDEPRDAELLVLADGVGVDLARSRRDLDLRRVSSELRALVSHSGEKCAQQRRVALGGEESVADARCPPPST